MALAWPARLLDGQDRLALLHVDCNQRIYATSDHDAQREGGTPRGKSAPSFSNIDKSILQIKTKIVYLIQKWAIRFEKQHDLVPLFSDVYKALQQSGVKFPPKTAPSKTGSSGGTEGTQSSSGSSKQSKPSDEKKTEQAKSSTGKIP